MVVTTFTWSLGATGALGGDAKHGLGEETQRRGGERGLWGGGGAGVGGLQRDVRRGAGRAVETGVPTEGRVWTSSSTRIVVVHAANPLPTASALPCSLPMAAS